jgi:ligand-binding sensor domain-containing protein
MLQWEQTNGPYGGLIRCLAVSGTKIFAGTNVGVFSSSDNGVNGMAINRKLPSTNVWCLAVNGQSLFTGTSKGVFRTINNGEDWTEIGLGLTQSNVISGCGQ